MKKVQNIVFQFLHEISSRFNLGAEIVEKEWNLLMEDSVDDMPIIVLIDDLTKGSESISDDLTKGSEKKR